MPQRVQNNFKLQFSIQWAKKICQTFQMFFTGVLARGNVPFSNEVLRGYS